MDAETKSNDFPLVLQEVSNSLILVIMVMLVVMLFSALVRLEYYSKRYDDHLPMMKISVGKPLIPTIGNKNGLISPLRYRRFLEVVKRSKKKRYRKGRSEKDRKIKAYQEERRVLAKVRFLRH